MKTKNNKWVFTKKIFIEKKTEEDGTETKSINTFETEINVIGDIDIYGISDKDKEEKIDVQKAQNILLLKKAE